MAWTVSGRLVVVVVAAVGAAGVAVSARLCSGHQEGHDHCCFTDTVGDRSTAGALCVYIPKALLWYMCTELIVTDCDATESQHN